MTFRSLGPLALTALLSLSPVAFAAKSGCDDLLKALEEGRGTRIHSLILRNRVAEAYAANPQGFMLAVITEQSKMPQVELDALLRAVLRRLR